MSRLRDPNRGGKRAAPVRRFTCNEARHAGAFLAEPERVGADVPSTTVRKRDHVRESPQLLDDLEGGGLLALEAQWVERIHEHVRAVRI